MKKRSAGNATKVNKKPAAQEEAEDEEEEDEGKEDEEQENDEQSGDEEFSYKWDTELKKAKRERDGRDPEWAIKITPGPSPEAPPVAKFKDGSEWLISDLTASDFLALRDSNKKAKTESDKVGDVDGFPLRICIKKDRHQLVLLMYKSKQVCQVRADNFPNLDEATKFMKTLGEMVASKKIAMSGLYAERDRMMTAFGGKNAPPVAKKRQAAATTSSSSAPSKTKTSATVSSTTSASTSPSAKKKPAAAGANAMKPDPHKVVAAESRFFDIGGPGLSFSEEISEFAAASVI